MEIARKTYWLLLLLTVIFLSPVHLHAQPVAGLATYMESAEVSSNAKDYHAGKFRASDDSMTLSIFDSLDTRNNTTRPFYIYLVSEIIAHADGALAEVAGVYCREFLENKPNELFAFLYVGNKISDKSFYASWLSMVNSEMQIADCTTTKLAGSDVKNAETCIAESKKVALSHCDKKYSSKVSLFYKQVSALLKK